jgi:O-antigen/teichoic acid export membrane protein
VAAFSTTQLFQHFSGPGLKAQVLRAAAWLGSGSVLEQIVRFGRNMVTARLLAPDAFGTMAILLSTTSLIHTVTDIGVREATIRNEKGAEDHYIRSAFWLSFGRALSLALGLFLLAPWIARFYGNLELTALLRITALTIVIDGATSPRTFAAMKNLRFSRIAFINNGGGILGVFVTVILSYFIRDVWALVLGLLAEVTSKLSLSYIFYPWLPYFSWHKEAARDLLKFSKGLFGLSFLNLIFARTDIFVMAKLFPAGLLGLYSMAIFIAQTPTSFLMNVLGQTLLPALSRVQNEDERANRILLQVSSLLLYLGMPAVTCAYFCGSSLLTLVYGARYSAAGGALALAAAVGLLNLLNGQITTVFYAKGLPHLHRRSVILMALSMIVFIYPCVKVFGPIGGQVAPLVAIVLGYAFQLERVRHLTGIRLTAYFKPFLLGTVLSVITAAVCSLAPIAGLPSGPGYTIVAGILGCLAAYLLAFVVFLRVQRSASKVVAVD